MSTVPLKPQYWANMGRHYDYIWIGSSQDGYMFSIHARCHDLLYKGGQYYMGGTFLGTCQDIDDAIGLAQGVIRARGGGFGYGVRISEEALDLAAWMERFELKALQAEAEQARLAQLEQMTNVMGDIYDPDDPMGLIPYQLHWG